MQADPRGAAEGIAHEVLHGHVCGEAAAVADVGRLAVGTVGAAHVVVVAAQHDGRADLTALDRFVEGLRDADAALAVGVQDARLAAHHELVLLRAADPVQVVRDLLADLGGGLLEHGFQHLSGDAVAGGQVLRIAAGAHPPERTEAVVEAERAHDVLHVAGVTELLSVLAGDVRTGAQALQQEGVAVVEEVHALFRQAVHGGHVAAQGLLHALLERGRVLHHERVALLVAETHGVVATGPRVVQAGLVAAEVHLDVACGEALPQVHHVAEEGDAVRFAVPLPFQRGIDAGVRVGDHLVHPALLVALVGGGRIDLRADGDHPRDVAGLGLGTAHAAETRGHEQAALGAPAVLQHA